MTDLSPGAGVAVGIIVGLMSTCVQSIGLTMQRKSHMEEDEKEDLGLRRPAYRRRRWQVGMFLFLIANIVGSTIQITTLPLPLLSTLQASGLVFNSILASLLLKEPWTWRTAYGTVLVAGGAAMISFFSALPEPSHNLSQLLVLLHQPSFLIWFILSLAFALGVLVSDFVLRKLVSIHLQESPRIQLIRGMSYGLLSGILSAHALLLAKSAVELIVRSLADHINEFSSYQSWLLLLAFLVLALSQLYYLHLGLKLISTSILYPFVFCIYNIVAILDGLIYFRQMDRLPPLHAGLIALGTMILLSGVLTLSWRLHDNDGDQPQMAQADIPQTLLTPGLGFAGEPEEMSTDSAAPSIDEDDDEEESDPERSPLIVTKRPRSRVSSRRRVSGRKRASTLKEVSQIWHELGDDDNSEDDGDGPYGTFGTEDDADGRPTSAGQQRHRRHRRFSAGRNLETALEDGTGFEPGAVQRAKTMPSKTRSTSEKRSRKSGHEGSALFAELLRREWWRSKRKEDEDREGEADEEAEGSGSGGASGGRRSSNAY